MTRTNERKGKQLRLAERKARAYSLSLAGWNYREISRDIGVSPQVPLEIQGEKPFRLPSIPQTLTISTLSPKMTEPTSSLPV